MMAVKWTKRQMGRTDEEKLCGAENREFKTKKIKK